MHAARSPIEGTPLSSPVETALVLSASLPAPPTSPAPISETPAEAADETSPDPHWKSTAPFDSSAASLPYAREDGGAASGSWSPLDVRVRPWLFAVTYWTGLAVVYAFIAYVVAFSPTWRGPVLVWAVLVPTVVGTAWRLLPSERRLIERTSDEVLYLRCGGLFSLADTETANRDTGVDGQHELQCVDEEQRRESAAAAAAQGLRLEWDEPSDAERTSSSTTAAHLLVPSRTQ